MNLFNKGEKILFEKNEIGFFLNIDLIDLRVKKER